MAEQRGDLYAPACPSRGVLDHVTSRWGVLVLVALLEGTHRFSELRRKVAGVSEKMLAQTLQALEEDGFVLREVYPVIPPRVDYSLTPMGARSPRTWRRSPTGLRRTCPASSPLAPSTSPAPHR